LTRTSSHTRDDGDESRARVVGELERAGLRATPEEVDALMPRYLRMRQLLKNLRSWLGPDSPEPAVTFTASTNSDPVENA
jgi:hypothetical protein